MPRPAGGSLAGVRRPPVPVGPSAASRSDEGSGGAPRSQVYRTPPLFPSVLVSRTVWLRLMTEGRAP